MELTILLVAAMCAVLAMTIREVVGYLRKREPFALRRLTIRLSMAGMLLFLLGSILVGVRVFALGDPHGNATLWMVFWTCIMLLIGAILCLVIADLRLLAEENRLALQHWREIARDIEGLRSGNPENED